MVNYENGKIYRIICNTTGLQYIGSTCCSLSSRLGEHKKNYKKYLNGKSHYVTSFKILENNNYQITLLENTPCNNKEELLRKERYYIEMLTCVNRIIPTRTHNEYYQDNREKILENVRNYVIENRLKIQECKRGYYQNNRESILEYHKDYYRNNKEIMGIKSKEIYEKNKESILQYHKDYYKNNLKKIKQYATKIIECECGSNIQQTYKSKHLKSKKHLKYLESLNNTN